MTNKWSPGCKCSCCNYCTDYYDPNEWYSRFCNVVSYANGSSNRQVDGSSTRYFSLNTLADEINSTLINWQFNLSEPSTTFPNFRDRMYLSPFVYLPALDQTIDYYVWTTGGTEPTTPTYTFVLSSSKAQITVYDHCGHLHTEGAVTSNLHVTYNATGGSITSSNHPIWAAYARVGTSPDRFRYSTGNCGQLIEADAGRKLDVNYYPTSTTLPGFFVSSPLSSHDYIDSPIYLKTKANDSLIACGGYGT